MSQVKFKGISYLEMILVIAIIAILMPLMLPFTVNFINRMNINSVRDKTVSSIRKAQLYAMDNKNNELWGVCLHNQNIRFYSRSCDDPVIKEDYTVPASIELTGLTDVSFSKFLGEPSQTVDITIESTSTQINISLNAIGGLNVY